MKRAAAAILGFAFFCVTLCAEQFGAVTVEAVPQAAQSNSLGYFIQEYRIANDGVKPAELSLRLSMIGSVYRSTSRRLLVAPGTVQNVTLYWPSATQTWRYEHGADVVLELVIDGRLREHSLSPGFYSIQGGVSNESTQLFSGTVSAQTHQALQENQLHYGRSATKIADIPVAQWGTHLRDYAGVSSVWIASTDQLPPAVERALMNWVFQGGLLVVCVGQTDPWPEGKEPADGKGIATRHGWGRRILVRPLPSEWKDEGGEGNKKENPIGLEYCRTLMRDASQQVGIGSISTAFSHLALPIPSIPLQWLFCVMLAFVLIVGPVNYFILKRNRREMLILLTTPVICLIFCLLVIGFISVHEGWFSRAKACGLTLLDQDRKLAATRALVSVYSPVTPRKGFQFEQDDVLRIRGVGRLVMNVDQSQQMAPGLIQPRIPLNYSIDRVGMQREHLKINREGDTVSVVNGLGVRINALAVALPDGKVFVWEQPIEPGALVPALSNLERNVKRTELDFSTAWNGKAEGSFTHVWSKVLIRGHYVALTDQPLFWTPGFEPDQFEVEHMVIGKYSFGGESGDGN